MGMLCTSVETGSTDWKEDCENLNLLGKSDHLYVGETYHISPQGS